jgi:hypothetical protein
MQSLDAVGVNPCLWGSHEVDSAERTGQVLQLRSAKSAPVKSETLELGAVDVAAKRTSTITTCPFLRVPFWSDFGFADFLTGVCLSTVYFSSVVVEDASPFGIATAVQLDAPYPRSFPVRLLGRCLGCRARVSEPRTAPSPRAPRCQRDHRRPTAHRVAKRALRPQ